MHLLVKYYRSIHPLYIIIHPLQHLFIHYKLLFIHYIVISCHTSSAIALAVLLLSPVNNKTSNPICCKVQIATDASDLTLSAITIWPNNTPIQVNNDQVSVLVLVWVSVLTIYWYKYHCLSIFFTASYFFLNVISYLKLSPGRASPNTCKKHFQPFIQSLSKHPFISLV